MKPEWILNEQNLQQIDLISKNTGIDKNITGILFSRGITKENDIIQFLNPELNNLHSPFLLHGIYEAINRLKTAINIKENIAIFGDSDLDGITSLTIIYSILVKYGCSPVVRYPKNKESYGLTKEIIDEFINQKISLVITVDSGIRDVEEIMYGKNNNIDFIITDHHEQDLNLPDAIIVNPKQIECGYPFKELAGVGVAFKFVQAFLYSYTSGFNVVFILIYKENLFYILHYVKNGVTIRELKINKDDIIQSLTNELKLTDYIVLLNDESLSLASIVKSIVPGITVTDLKKIAESLNNINYKNNKTMLEKLAEDFKIDKKNISNEFILYYKLFIELHWRSSKKIFSVLQEYVVLVTIGTIADIMPMYGENRQLIIYGLSLLNQGRGHHGILTLTSKSRTTSKSISWDIAPLLNAPGRMGETGLTVNFFLENNISKIEDIIKAIQKINNDRKKRVSEIIEKIKNDPGEFKLNDNIFFYMSGEIIDGLAGLIANRIADDLKKPAIIATGSDKNGIVKGSARSSGNFDFFKYTENVSHLFERVGGHSQAFGFTAEKRNIKEIIDTINKSISGNFIPDQSVKIDLVLQLNDITAEFVDSLSALEPFGKYNEEPVFALKNILIDSLISFGNHSNHGKFTINNRLQVIGWNMLDRMSCYSSGKKEVDIIFKLENNEYMGKVSPRLILIDIDFSK